jgi:membrane-associated phospholipid phosphatase
MTIYKLRWFILVYGVVCIALLLLALLAHAYPYFQWDLRWEVAWQAVDAPGLAPLMRALTWMGDDWRYAITVALAAIALALWGNLKDAVAVVGSVIGGTLFAFIIKILVRRPRPSLPEILVMRARPSFGFPSGHVVRFMIFYGFLFALAYFKLRYGVGRTLTLILLGVLLISIGLSRVYVGEHWPSDVLGGYLTGLCWLGPALLAYWRLRVPRRSILTGYPPLP